MITELKNMASNAPSGVAFVKVVGYYLTVKYHNYSEFGMCSEYVWFYDGNPITESQAEELLK